MIARVLIAIALLAGTASADPRKVAFGADKAQEATIRAGWKAWIKTSPTWTEATGPAAAVVADCFAAAPTCAPNVIALQADQTWIVKLVPPASNPGEHVLVGRIYDRGGALIATKERTCARCSTNRAALTAELGSLLDGMRDDVDRLETRLVIEVPDPSVPVTIDDRPVDAPAPGQPIQQVVAPGPHTLGVGAGDCWQAEPREVNVPAGQTVRAVLSATARPPRLQIRTGTGGVAIAIDGAPAGVTAADGTLAVESTPGRHRVEATRGGARAAPRDVTLAPCQTGDVDLTLAPASMRRSRSLVPYAVGAGGVVLVGVGLTLVLADRETVNDDGNRAATYRDSAPWGLAIGGAGVVALGAATYLWYRDRPRDTAPIVAITPGGVSVGLAARF